MGYTAGIIGAGGIAGLGILGLHDEDEIGCQKFTASHAGGYHAHDDITLTAVADVDQDKLTRFGDAWDIPPDNRYTDHEAMLAATDLDIVSVCSPTFLHHDHVVDAATAPAAPDLIWCEKPIASNVRDAEHMAAVCTQTDTELVINHSFRFTEKMQTLQHHIQSGLLGDIRSVSASFRRELLRNSTHLLDTIIFLMDVRADTVSGYINGENDAVDALGGDTTVEDAGGGGHVVLSDGTFATIDCTLDRDISSMSLTFIGTDGKFYLNNDDGEWRYWDLTDTGHTERDIPGIDDPWDWTVDYERAFPNAATHLIDVLEGRADNLSSGHDATRSLEIIIGFYLSHYVGTHVTIPLEEPLRDISVTSW